MSEEENKKESIYNEVCKLIKSLDNEMPAWKNSDKTLSHSIAAIVWEFVKPNK